jgi:hypothetical protein
LLNTCTGEDAVLDGEIACIGGEGRPSSKTCFSENPPVCTSPLICCT